MLCPQCNTDMRKRRARYRYQECGLDNIWLDNWPVFVCLNCKISLPMLPDAADTAKAVASALVQENGHLDGDSIVFLRKTMGLKAADLAEQLGVNRVTVSRWENNKQQIDAYYDFRLRFQAIDRILPADIMLRESVSRVLERTYIPNLSMASLKITVPADTQNST